MTPLDEQLLVAIDFETTGLDATTDRIIEVGAIRFDRSGKELGSFQSLVNGGKPSHPRALAVHGIPDEDQANAPAPSVVYPKLIQFLGDPGSSVLIAHNASFDAAFFGAELARLGIDRPGFSVIDTLPLARQVFPEFRSHGLDSLSRRLGFDRSESHRALADCRRVMWLWLAATERSAQSEAALVRYHVHEPNFVSVAPKGWDELVDATRKGMRVRITYSGGTRGTDPREISPRRFVNRGGITYLVSFCHLDGREKEFRLDRLVRYELIDQMPVR